MAKNIPKTKFTELKGLDRISLVTHEMKCLFRVISQDDVGIDGEIELLREKADGKGFETEGGIIKVQAKSGASYVKRDSVETFATPVRKEDLEYWNNCTFPVFFIVYHPADDELYYKPVQTYVRETFDVFQRPYEIIFDKSSDRFSIDSKASVWEQAAKSPARLSFDEQERHYSNLFPVLTLPERLTFARTRRKSRKAVKEAIKGYTPPFCVRGGLLFTLDDLRDPQCVLRDYCDAQSAESMSRVEFVDSDDSRRDYVSLLNQLFGSHCLQCGMAYNPEYGRTYFPRPRLNRSVRKVEQRWTSPRTGRSDIRAVAQYYEYGDFKFWRHTAAQFQFIDVGDAWYLQVLPKYLFTNDGEKPCHPKLVGPYTTKLKALEHNPQVLNHVLFWGHALARGNNEIELTLHDKVVMRVAAEPLTCVAGFAIPLDPAVHEESTPSLQLTFDGWNDAEAGHGD